MAWNLLNVFVSVVDLHIMSEHLNYWELRKTVTIR
jgi:hypothetical protein